MPYADKALFVGGDKHGDLDSIPDYVQTAGRKLGLKFPVIAQMTLIPDDGEVHSTLVTEIYTWRQVGYHEDEYVGWQRGFWAIDLLNNEDAKIELGKLLMQRWVAGVLGPEFGEPSRQVTRSW